MPDLIRHTTPTARTENRCMLCTGPIGVGETYTRDTLVFDGRVYAWTECRECAAEKVGSLVLDWAGDPDEGVDAAHAHEWACENPDNPTAVAFLRRWVGEEARDGAAQ
jgi:hypothetical protein